MSRAPILPILSQDLKDGWTSWRLPKGSHELVLPLFSRLKNRTEVTMDTMSNDCPYLVTSPLLRADTLERREVTQLVLFSRLESRCHLLPGINAKALVPGSTIFGDF